MYALRKAQKLRRRRQGLLSLRRVVLVVAGTALLGILVTASADTPPTVGPKSGGADGARAASKGSPDNANPVLTKHQPKPVKLPGAGRHPAKALFHLIEALTGEAVSSNSSGLETTKIGIAPALAKTSATLLKLRVLLGAHGIFLTEQESDGGWLATRDPALLRKTPERILRVFDIGPRHFRRSVEEVERFTREHNKRLPSDVPLTRVLPISATGRLAVRTHSERVLLIVGEILRGVAESVDTKRSRFYVHRALNYRASDLWTRLNEKLTERQRKRLRVVIPQRTNALWIRTTPAVWTDVQKVLKVLDGKPIDVPDPPANATRNSRLKTGPDARG